VFIPARSRMEISIRNARVVEGKAFLEAKPWQKIANP